MSRISTYAKQAGAKAPAKARTLKTYRVSFSEARHYYYDVQAITKDAAIEAGMRLADRGDEGTDHRHGGAYASFESVEEVQS